MVKTIGDLLREARTKKGLALQTIAKETGVSDHHLLAIELDQFNLIAEDKLDTYLSAYASMVGLDMDDLESLKTSQETENLPLETSYDELILKTDRPDSLDSRSYRHHTRRYEDKKKNSRLPLFILSLVALGILGFVGWTFVKNSNVNFSLPNLIQEWTSPTAKKEKKEVPAESSSSEPSPSSETKESSTESSTTAPSASEESKVELVTTGGGDSMEVIVKGATSPIEVEISLNGAESSWVGLTNSDLGEMGTLLNADYSSYKATMDEGAKEGVLMFGITQGISVKVSGQELDMSPITSTANSTITLIIE